MSDADAVKKMRGVLKEAKTGPDDVQPRGGRADPGVGARRRSTPEQIAEALAPVRDAIKAAPKDGMAMGVAMKALAGQPVESDDVKAAVAAIRRGG